MRKALGLLACTTFAAAGIWSVIPGSATRHVSAEQPNSGNASRSVTPVSDSRSTTLGRLNPFTRSTSNKNSKDGYRQAATQLLDDAKDLAARGDVAGARRLAERAQSFPIDWAPNERSPENFLAQLDADSKGRSKPSSKPATAIAKRPAAPQSGNGNSLANLETLTNGKPARNSIAPVIAQASNEESFDESADEPLEEVVTPTKQSAPAGTQPASGKLSAAKELMQQSRSELAKGNFDAARAKADQARGMNVAYGVFDERPEQILAQIDRLENNNHESAPRTQNLAQSAKKTAPAKRVAANFNDSPFDEEAPARPTTVAKTSPSAPEQKQTQDDEHESAPRTQTLAQSSKKTAPAKRVAANFDDSPFDAEAPARPATVAKTSRPAPAQKQIQDDDVPFDEPAPSRNQAAQKISPKSGSPFVQSLVGDDAPETADPADAGELAPTNNDQQLSQQLLSQSQSAINKGNLEQARTLALQAQELDVAYGLFDLRPDHVIAKIDRASNNLTIAKNGTKAKDAAKQLANSKPLTNLQPQRKELPTEEVDSPFAKLATSARDLGQDVAEDKATVKVRQQAMTALQQARQEMQAGRLDAARQKVLAVQKLNATYGLWDDRPEALLEEIGRVELAQKSTPTPKTSPDQSKARALTLMKQARADLAAGRVDAAKQKAEQAEAMNVAFEVFEDRPDLVLNAIQRVSHKSIDVPPEPEEGVELLPIRPAPIANRIAPKGLPETPDSSMPRQATRSNPVVMQTELESVPPADDVSEEPAVVAIHPEGPSAEQLFREGQIHLNTGNKGAAYQAFLKAYQSGQKLDARRGQQLQDYLRELSPRRNKSIQLAGNQVGTQLSADNESDLNGPAEPRELDLQRPLDIASSRQKVQLDKLRNEVLNTIYRAERLKDQKEPTKALEALDHTMANIESSGLDKSLTASLSSTLLKSRVSIESNQKLQEPNLIQKAENDDVKQTIARIRSNKVRTEREFAKLVQQFNELMDQKRYSEAEVIAKQAKDLDSDNPVSETLVYKSQLARRVDSNDRLKSDKEAGFWDTLNSVELSGIPFNDMKSVEFGKDWNDIKKRRSGGKYGTDNRIRSPEEQRIESNLSRPISLHFENAPLKKVIEHLATIADINVMLDTAGLEEESLSVSTPVSINVDSIKMKSALNLLLEPLNLGYTIKHEVLQITSGTRLQGQLVPVTYSVADLVVTIQPTQSSSPFANINGTGPMGGSGFAGGQMSVSPTGGSQGGQFQVAGAQTAPSVTPWLASSSPQWQQAPHNNGHDFRELIDLITTTCEPSSWLEVGGGGHCKGNDSTLSLVIRQTQKVHDEIRDLLEQLRRLQDLQVTIEVRFISVSDTFFERIGIDFSFDVQDNLGGPNLINSTGGGGQQGGGGQGGQQGQGGGLSPIPPFGSIISGGQQQGQQGQQGGQQGQQGQQGGQAGGGNFFTPGPSRQHTDRDSYKKGGSILGLSSSNSFTQDQDIAFRQGSFAVGVPDFGRFDANAGLNVGFAILSDIETFFFINAAQGDRRSNIMSAPKVTLFNGQNASVFDGQQRPFVTSLIPVVGAFAVGYQPQLTVVPDGVGMSVTAVISADRRFVRLQITPFIQQIVDIVAFSFVSAGGGGGGGGQQGGGGQGGGGQGGGGQGGGQFGQGGIGGGPAMESGGLYNHGMFGRAMGGSEDYANLAQSGFGGIGGAGGLHVLESTLLSQGQQGGGQQGGGQQGGGQQGGGQQGGGVQAAGAGTVSVQLPVVASTNVGTVVSVPDGGTVLLGGVKRLRESRNMAGVPILNKIPYISRLFKNTGVGRETSSLMLMVTPRIVILEEEEGLLGIPN